MTSKMKEKIKIEIEIGHWAKRLSSAPTQPVLPNSSVQNATHVWKVWVCGRHGELESFVERVVFQLHPTFPDPMRVVSQPPFEIEEKAFGTFPMKIELHFNNSMAGFEYEVFLMLDKDINCKSIKSFSIANPRPPEFREKLIRAGGIVVDPAEDSPLGPAEVKPAKTSKLGGSGSSGLVRSKSKSKAAAAALLPADEQTFASPASSTDEQQLANQLAVHSGSLPQSPQQQSQLAAAGSGRSIVGSRLASPNKAKLRESSGTGGYSARPKQQPAAVKTEPAVAASPAVSEFDLSQQQLAPPPPPPPPAPPRVAELRTDEMKNEKLVLKISKSPIKSSPGAVPPPPPVAVKAEASVSALPPADASYTLNPPPQQQQQQGWSAPPTAAPPAMVAVVAPHVAVDSMKSSPTSVAQQPPATYSESAASWQPSGSGAPGLTTESEDDRRKRKKEKRKKEKHHRHHHHHHHRAPRSRSDSDSDAERKRHERRRHRHEGGKEKKRRRHDEPDGDDVTEASALAAPAAAAPVAVSVSDQLQPVDNTVGIEAKVAAPQAPQAAVSTQPQAAQPPPMLEAEPPMLSPYLQSAAGPKDDPELMSQVSVESTGFRPAAGAEPPSSSADSSPLAAASIPISAAAMAAESSALARHPKYQWSAQSGLSREEYDQRFQLCLLAASLDDPDRLQLLASVLAESEALTNKDKDYANFDLARLRPDCVKRLIDLLMPDSAS
ncbi:hypothetical protein BOX15_Mlig021564g1 [Macrostomum lignano]|uniref:YEATS domain-containing protein n=2 Tax=Macrostomum lignano TaxID=282301 RepID=A0A267EKI0_9PLAT|nr:hypothetical protein BOX15_Mlig021564g1 [Macrostomum lignano]